MNFYLAHCSYRHEVEGRFLEMHLQTIPASVTLVVYYRDNSENGGNYVASSTWNETIFRYWGFSFLSLTRSFSLVPAPHPQDALDRLLCWYTYMLPSCLFNPVLQDWSRYKHNNRISSIIISIECSYTICCSDGLKRPLIFSGVWGLCRLTPSQRPCPICVHIGR